MPDTGSRAAVFYDVLRPLAERQQRWALSSAIQPAKCDTYSVIGNEGDLRMPTYIVLVTWTDQGARTVNDSAKRLDAGRKLLEDMGDGSRPST